MDSVRCAWQFALDAYLIKMAVDSTLPPTQSDF